MKKLLIVGALAVGLGGLFTGCATVTRLPGDKACPTPDGREVVEYIDIQNTSWKLLCFIPIGSGDVKEPNEVSCSWFTDTCTLDNQLGMLAAETKRVGASQAVDVTSKWDSQFVLFVLLKKYVYHTSATLVK